MFSGRRGIPGRTKLGSAAELSIKVLGVEEVKLRFCNGVK